MKKYTTQVKIVLQGKVQSFEEYQNELNTILQNLKVDWGNAIVMPCCAADGRMCVAINYRKFLTVPKQEKKKRSIN